MLGQKYIVLPQVRGGWKEQGQQARPPLRQWRKGSRSGVIKLPKIYEIMSVSPEPQVGPRSCIPYSTVAFFIWSSEGVPETSLNIFGFKCNELRNKIYKEIFI